MTAPSVSEGQSSPRVYTPAALARECPYCRVVTDNFRLGKRRCYPCELIYNRTFNRSYYLRNQEKALAAQKKDYYLNRERKLEHKRIERLKNPEVLRERKRRWALNNPEKAKASQRQTRLKAAYGLTLADFSALLQQQEGECAICEVDIAGSGKAYIDHDHATGRVRGLLCHPCNTMLGCAKDNEATLQEAIAYLRRNIP